MALLRPGFSALWRGSLAVWYSRKAGRSHAGNKKSGVVKVSMPVYRVNKMGVMTERSDADIAKLKQTAAR